jgi:ubiquinone/menaquinone biosynthesis C-methylase UbiE
MFFKESQASQGFEWYATYEELDYFFKLLIKNQDAKILVVGCGNSLVSEKLYSVLGLKNIVSIDFESAIIKKMNERESPVEYKVMDMLNMDGIADNSIDFIVDKGSLDALCSDPSPETQLKVKQYFAEVSRVLAEDGTYVGVSLL